MVGTGSTKSSPYFWLGVIVMSIAAVCGVIYHGSHPYTPAPPAETSEISKLLQGDHPLRQVATTTQVDGHVSGGYFLFVGGLEGMSESRLTVSFAWEDSTGTYHYTTLPLDKIQVVPNENITKPFVKFRWTGHYGNTPDDAILYAVFGVNPKDWPEQIHMPIGPAH